jgi:hypothetical protein
MIQTKLPHFKGHRLLRSKAFRYILTLSIIMCMMMLNGSNPSLFNRIPKSATYTTTMTNNYANTIKVESCADYYYQKGIDTNSYKPVYSF